MDRDRGRIENVERLRGKTHLIVIERAWSGGETQVREAFRNPVKNDLRNKAAVAGLRNTGEKPARRACETVSVRAAYLGVLSSGGRPLVRVRNRYRDRGYPIVLCGDIDQIFCDVRCYACWVGRDISRTFQFLGVNHDEFDIVTEEA